MDQAFQRRALERAWAFFERMGELLEETGQELGSPVVITADDAEVPTCVYDVPPEFRLVDGKVKRTFHPGAPSTWQNFDPNDRGSWQHANYLQVCPACGEDHQGRLADVGEESAEITCNVCGCNYELRMEVRVRSVHARGVDGDIWDGSISKELREAFEVGVSGV